MEPLAVVRAELSLLTKDQPDMELLAEAGSVHEAVATVRHIRQSQLVVVVALGLADEHDSFWLIRTLREQFPVAAIIVCGAKADPITISRALFVGADGYVDEGVEAAEFLQALRAASRGEIVLVRPGEVGPIAEGAALREELEEKLTIPELGVLAGAAQGLTAREIGRRLGVAERTVRSHLRRTYRKLGVNGPIAAILMAARSGLVTVRSSPSTT